MNSNQTRSGHQRTGYHIISSRREGETALFLPARDKDVFRKWPATLVHWKYEL
jgi:hypothetical protein